MNIFKTEEHASIASTFHQIASLYSHLGQYEKALDISKNKVLKINMNIFKTEEHASIATTYH